MTHNQNNTETRKADILVIGAGIAGITTSLEAAETGKTVFLLEKNAYIGGRITQLNEYFPKLCPPTCGLEVNLRRLKDNDNIKLFTLAEICNIEGYPGNYVAEVLLKPRFVSEACTNCHECSAVCPVDMSDEFNLGMSKTKAIYLPYNNAYPQRFVIDKGHCKGIECSECVKVCKFYAINLSEEPIKLYLNVKSIVWATGWTPYDANRLSNLGFGKYQNVISNLMMERLAAPNGPTKGEIKINGIEDIRKVAFIQCAGSRDELHLEFCSSVCCMASLKQAHYIRERYKDAEIHIFYIDLRSPGFFEEFYRNTKKDEKIFFHRGKGAKVISNPETGKLIVEAEDTINFKLMQYEVDLIVLATGMQPEKFAYIPDNITDENGFVFNNDYNIACGVCTGPKDVASSVQEATAASLRAILQGKEDN